MQLTVLAASGVNLLLVLFWISLSRAERLSMTPLDASGSALVPQWPMLALAGALSLSLAALPGTRLWRVARVVLSAAGFAAVWLFGPVLRGPDAALLVLTPWPGVLAMGLLLWGAWRSLSRSRSAALLLRDAVIREAEAGLPARGFAAVTHVWWPLHTRHLSSPELDVALHLTPGHETGWPLTARWPERAQPEMQAVLPGAFHVQWVVLIRPRQRYEPQFWPGGVTVIGGADALLSLLEAWAAHPPQRVAVPPRPTSAAEIRTPRVTPSFATRRVKARRVLAQVPGLLAAWPDLRLTPLDTGHWQVQRASGGAVTLLVWPHPECPVGWEDHPDAALSAALAAAFRRDPQAVVWAPLLASAAELCRAWALLPGPSVVLGAGPDAVYAACVSRWAGQVPTPHEVLGVPPGATREEVRSAYRALIKRHHPDRTGHLTPPERLQAEERSKQINAAYSALQDGF